MRCDVCNAEPSIAPQRIASEKGHPCSHPAGRAAGRLSWVCRVVLRRLRPRVGAYGLSLHPATHVAGTSERATQNKPPDHGVGLLTFLPDLRIQMCPPPSVSIIHLFLTPTREPSSSFPAQFPAQRLLRAQLASHNGLDDR
jgi:hypothetical protein